MKKRRAILREVLKNGDLKKLDKKTFLKAWKALFFLHQGLHPDESGHSDGGWPRRLKPLAREAFRRFENGDLTDNELYPVKEILKRLKTTSHLSAYRKNHSVERQPENRTQNRRHDIAGFRYRKHSNRGENDDYGKKF